MSLAAETLADLTKLDQYAPLNHKTPFRWHQESRLAPTWVGNDNQRRLAAYTVLHAYVATMSRILLTTEDRGERREYGEPGLFVERIVAGILGDDNAVVVDGADDDLTKGPTLPERPGDLGDTASDIERRVHTILTDLWETQATDAVDRWEQALGDQPDLIAIQDLLREWADAEFLDQKMVEAESDAVALGDTVYELVLSTVAGRPHVHVHDPGMYFPVLADSDEGYPRKVHLAWEYEDDQGNARIRRITYELVDLDVARSYPWNAEPSFQTVLKSEGTWPLNVGARTVDDLDRAMATWEMSEDGDEIVDLDINVDFIPVVHIPNTPASREHFGRSVLLLVIQLLDDLQATDSDVQAAAALAAGPVIALPGGDAGEDDRVIAPGIVWNLPADAHMDVLDLTAGLDRLMTLKDQMLDRLAVNMRTPNEVLGRVKDGQVPSGVQVALRFGPFTQLILMLRLVRNQKYRLLLKMVQRFYQILGNVPAGDTAPARMAFGSFLPSDLAGVVDVVTRLLAAHALSRATALDLLVEAGVSIDDATAELDRIQAEDGASALEIANATGSEELAAEYLGLDLPEPPPASTLAGLPTITPPGQPTPPPAPPNGPPPVT